MLPWLRFLVSATSAGLALAFIVVLFRPELLPTRRPVVKVQAAHTGEGASIASSYSEAVARASAAVVNIHSTRVVPRPPHPTFEDPELQRRFGDLPGADATVRVQNSLGSGVIISSLGHVLTNYHVVAGAEDISLTLQDGRRVPARLVGTDADTDLAVLQAEITRPPSITVGSSATLRPGDVVLAIGNPFGYGQTVTLGIVSAVGRDRLGLNTFEDFIQTDAAINPGNSGGALINPAGELVGINTAVASRRSGASGIGFAIPVDLARDVLRQIVEQGYVVRGWLGIRAASPAQTDGDADGLAGVLVVEVFPDGPGDRAGLRPGDLITRVEAGPVRDVRSLLDRIAMLKPGDRITLEVLRGERPLTLEARVGQRPSRNLAAAEQQR